MDAITSLRESIGTSRWLLTGTLEGLTADLAHKHPGGKAHPIAALYAHTVLSEDMMINGMLQGKQPLAASSFAGKTGISEMPPHESEGPTDWTDWGKRVKVDLAAAQAYAQAVYAATDAYLSTLKPDDLDRKVQLAGMDMSVNTVIDIAASSHAASHTGEIAAIKGIQGEKGFPL